MRKKRLAAGSALIAALLYAMNVPLSKLLLVNIAPSMLAALLYLGAGLGLLAAGLAGRARGKKRAEPFTRAEAPYVIGMVLLDVAAPVLLMYGILLSSSASASLLSNFEIVATTVIALALFGERISGKLWAAIALVTLASALLSFEGAESFTFNSGSLLVAGACVCWGFENNCTRKLSGGSPVRLVTVKGCFSGLGCLIVALISGEPLPPLRYLPAALLLGFVAYGLSISFYIYAQRTLGAARTSAFYSVAPFLGAGLSLAMLGERPAAVFYAALAIMAAGALLLVSDTLSARVE